MHWFNWLSIENFSYLFLLLLLSHVNKNKTGHIFVKWVSTTIAKSYELGEIDLKTVEQLVSVLCTHLIAAGVMKQIIDGDEMTKDVFCVSELFSVLIFASRSIESIYFIFQY